MPEKGQGKKAAAGQRHFKIADSYLPAEVARLTIPEIQAWLKEHWDDGAVCPACTQLVKMYRRKLTAQMCYCLILLYHEQMRMPFDGWIDLTEFLKRHGINAANANASLLSYWDLIVSLGGRREDGSTRVGLYRVTERGMRFVRREIKVEKWVKTYNQKLYRDERGKYVTIDEAMGVKFNYADLMAGE